MKFGTDIDGVLADFVTTYIEVAKLKLGVEMPPVSESFPDVWDFDLPFGITVEQRMELISFIENSAYCVKHFPLKGAIDALQTLDVAAKFGNDVYFVTSRSGTHAKHLTETWLQNYGMTTPTVILSCKKSAIAQILDFDVYVDDNTKNVQDAAWTMKDGSRVYMVDQPYNREANSLHPRITRVKNINDAVLREFPGLFIESKRKAA